MESNRDTPISAGQTYRTNGQRRIHWRILSVDTDTVHAVRIRKADGERWVWDSANNGRDFSFAIVAEHWTLIA